MNIDNSNYKERPILFTGEMVRAILCGKKTQTRRVVKPTKDRNGSGCELAPCEIAGEINKSRNFDLSPYGKIGDRLWVRETFCPIFPQDPDYNNGEPIEYDYRADYQHGTRLGDVLGIKKIWKPSIFMPRDAARITLEITNIRVERLNDISEEDALAEGVKKKVILDWPLITRAAWCEFRNLWSGINGEESWDLNPWVWVIGFKRI